MQPSVCSYDICEAFKDALRRFNGYQKVWHNQAKEKRKCELIRNRQEENASEEEIHQFLQSLENNDDQLMRNNCNGNCHTVKSYKTFSERPSMCRAALLCKHHHLIFQCQIKTFVWFQMRLMSSRLSQKLVATVTMLDQKDQVLKQQNPNQNVAGMEKFGICLNFPSQQHFGQDFVV